VRIIGTILLVDNGLATNAEGGGVSGYPKSHFVQRNPVLVSNFVTKNNNNCNAG